MIKLCIICGDEFLVRGRGTGGVNTCGPVCRTLRRRENKRKQGADRRRRNPEHVLALARANFAKRLAENPDGVREQRRAAARKFATENRDLVRARSAKCNSARRAKDPYQTKRLDRKQYVARRKRQQDIAFRAMEVGIYL